jgi:transposase InsO family protein
VIDRLVGAGFSVKRCYQVLGVSSQGYYAYRRRPMSQTKMRREWLVALVREVHADSRSTYGARRVHAELTKAKGIHVTVDLVTLLMHDIGIARLPGLTKVNRIKGTPGADDLVQRKFARFELDELWFTDITEHKTRESKVYCCSVMDTCSRQIVGWSIDSVQDAQLRHQRARHGDLSAQDTPRLDRPRRPRVQFTSWSFTDRFRQAGMTPSFGLVGDAFNNAMTESF